MQQLLQLQVHHIERPVPETMVVFLEAPNGFNYEAGQHLTLLLDINGRELRRSYALCSLPEDPFIAIVIRKVTNGEVSRHLLITLKTGDCLTSLPPSGRFTLQPAEKQVFFAAGAGINPILPLIRKSLRDSATPIALYYSESEPANCLFYDELLALQAQHPAQFQIYWHFSQVINRSTHLNGRLNQYVIEKAFAAPASLQKIRFQFYLCGPMTYMRMIRLSLQFMGYTADQIRRENFASEGIQVKAKALEPRPTFEVVVQMGKRSFRMQSQETVLAGAQAAGLSLAYSCNNGQCGTCALKLEHGEVIHRINEVLTDTELEAGYFLSCSAVPNSRKLVVAI